MATITTQSFSLTPKQYFRIFLRRSAPKILVIFGLYAFISFSFWLIGDMYFAWGFLMAIPLLGLMFLLIARLRTHSKKNNNVFKECYCVFNENIIETYATDGTYSKMPFNNILKIRKTKDYYLLYLTGIMFRYLPVSAFANPADHQQFEKLLVQQGLLKVKS